MSKRSNTVPYTNAARAGRTQPGLIEVRDTPSVPSLGPWVGAFTALSAPNRAGLRARGIRGSASRRLPGLHARYTKTFRPKAVEA